MAARSQRLLSSLAFSFAFLPAGAQAALPISLSGTHAGEAAKGAQCCLFVSVANAGSQSELLALDRRPPYDALGQVAPEPGGYPWFLAVSKKGELFVGDPASSTVYGYGSGYEQPPTREYPQTGDPMRLAVGADGTLYVAVSVSSGDSSYVVEYPKGRQKPGLMLAGPTGFLGLSLAVDTSGNVYIASEPKKTQATELLVYPAGSTSGTVVTLNTEGADLLSGGLAVDGSGDLLVGLVDANLCPHVYVYPAGQTSPSGEIGPPNNSFCGSASNIHSISLFGDKLYVGMLDAAYHVIEYAYPSGTFVAGWSGPPSLPVTLTTAVGKSAGSL